MQHFFILEGCTQLLHLVASNASLSQCTLQLKSSQPLCRFDGFHRGSWNWPHHLLAALSHLVDREQAQSEQLAFLGFLYLHCVGRHCHYSRQHRRAAWHYQQCQHLQGLPVEARTALQLYQKLVRYWQLEPSCALHRHCLFIHWLDYLGVWNILGL